MFHTFLHGAISINGKVSYCFSKEFVKDPVHMRLFLPIHAKLDWFAFSVSEDLIDLYNVSLTDKPIRTYRWPFC